MGIPGIYKHIGPGERVALSKLAVEHLEDTGRPLRIAIDISIWQFQIQSGQGGRNPALRTLYYRLLRLLALSIQPLFVFDGPHKPQFKRGKSTAPGAACLPDYLTKELLKRFGFPYHTAPGEAEAECALLQREGLVDAVLSEDVDTMMFGCSISLRNWSAEGARGNKSPTHINIYRAQKTKEASGLDSEGMILVALMSGGDYLPAGIPRCGPKIACEAAKAGFGHDLCQIPRGAVSCLNEWRERLGHELRTNESKFFRQKHKTLKIPDTFPDLRVLGYYTHPAVSSKDRLSTLRESTNWNSKIRVSELRSFVADAFDWACVSGAKKFIRGLAPALLAHQLIQRSSDNEDNANCLEARESAESFIVKAIHDRRSHWNTDGVPELRISYVPKDIVQIDLTAEQEDFHAEDLSEEDQPAFGDENARDRSQSPMKRRGLATYDPGQVEKIWLLETYMKLGVPLLVETWEEDMRDPKKFASRKAAARKKTIKPKAGINAEPSDAMYKFVKVTKPSSTRVPEKKGQTQRPDTDHLPPVFLAPAISNCNLSPRKKAPAGNQCPLGKKAIHKDANVLKNHISKTKTGEVTSETSLASIQTSIKNPWTLSRRPSDTLRFKSLTRYSALGIYPPDIPEHQDKPQPPSSEISNESKETPISLPVSPTTPKKRRVSPPTTPTSDSEPKPLPTPRTNPSKSYHHTDSLSTPKDRDHNQPAPRKKRSPLEQAHNVNISRQLRTPTSLRKETTLDRFLERGEAKGKKDDEETKEMTNQKVNRKLEFPKPKTSKSNTSPTSDTESLPSPSTLMSPSSIVKQTSNENQMTKDSFPVSKSCLSLGREDRVRRLIMLRESLEGAWKDVQPWEGEGEIRVGVGVKKRVYGAVEVLDLTAG